MAPITRSIKQAKALPLAAGDAMTRVRRARSRAVVLPPAIVPDMDVLHNLRTRTIRAPQRSGFKIRLASTKMRNLVITDRRLGMFSTLPPELRDTIVRMALHDDSFDDSSDKECIPVTVYKDKDLATYFTFGTVQATKLPAKRHFRQPLQTLHALSVACPFLASEVRTAFFSIYAVELTMTEIYFEPPRVKQPKAFDGYRPRRYFDEQFMRTPRSYPPSQYLYSTPESPRQPREKGRRRHANANGRFRSTLPAICEASHHPTRNYIYAKGQITSSQTKGSTHLLSTARLAYITEGAHCRGARTRYSG